MQASVIWDYGRILVRLKDEKHLQPALAILSKVPGISSVMPAIRCGLDLEELKRSVIIAAKDKDFSTFRISAHRQNKNFRYTSAKLNNILGKHVQDTFSKKARMKDPDLDIRVTIAGRDSFVCTSAVQGIGGLPTDPRQKMVCLISGGIDSPVAAYLMMKRGIEVILVHCQNRGRIKDSVQDKVEQLAGKLSSYQQDTVLHIIPFEDIQKRIIMGVGSSMRMLVYRRFMLGIAAMIADAGDSDFIVVGDSISQVASQTLENLHATYSSAEKNILAPLIGMNKDEIVAIARQIGTYDISILPYPDCCSLYLPEHPELRARPQDIDLLMQKLSSHEMIKKATEQAHKIRF
jgi:thiamine biosynthesis protein ThiI